MKEELYKLHTLIYIWMGINQNISNRFFKLMVWRLLLHTTNIQCFFFSFYCIPRHTVNKIRKRSLKTFRENRYTLISGINLQYLRYQI